MNVPPRFENGLKALALSALPLLYLEISRVVAGAPFSLTDLILGWAFIWAVWLGTWATLPARDGKSHWNWSWTGPLLLAIGAISGVVYVSLMLTAAAWVLLAVIFILVFDLDILIAAGKNRMVSVVSTMGLGLAAGLVSVAITSLESHFADEEFFVALQALDLAIFWLLLRFVGSKTPALNFLRVFHRKGLRWRSIWVVPPMLALAVLGVVLTVRAYQHSFYPDQAPGYPGITENSPFLCGQAHPDNLTYEGKDVFAKMLALVAANPNKGTPEFGMLALGSGDASWANTFHDSILDEARQEKFTQPANSVKSVQFDAALRAYYYPRVSGAFPGLFTSDEQKTIRSWFEAINRRAMTVEWVDWMYALAFDQWPRGPYENQEIGAGLLALLESQGLGDPGLSPENQRYLEQNPRGWLERFRVTDDAIVYQPEWINNAFFQYLYTGEKDENDLKDSFEWLLHQSLPDGALLRYNHPAPASLGGVFYLGAKLLDDQQLLWLSGRALDYLAQTGKYLPAAPGAETLLNLTARSPTSGSCLIFGDSGLPNQVGPLAPDKIVFRDGWSENDAYLLLNLRFSGWHRYKATNTATLFYQDGPLISDEMSGKIFSWLPVGRSLFRDKRIPRENLNGFLVGKTGMSAVSYALTGIGGSWAQDPPYYTEVKQFNAGSQLETSTTVIRGWRGWDSSRTVDFYHGGPTIFWDQAVRTGKLAASNNVSLVWHLVSDENDSQPSAGNEYRFMLRKGESPAEVVFLPVEPGEIRTVFEKGQESQPGLQVQFLPGSSERLSLVTVFLTGDWVGASVQIAQDQGGPVLHITQGSRRIDLPLYPAENGAS